MELALLKWGLARQSIRFDKIATNSIQVLKVPVSGMPDNGIINLWSWPDPIQNTSRPLLHWIADLSVRSTKERIYL
jgi:hypothetical protein